MEIIEDKMSALSAIPPDPATPLGEWFERRGHKVLYSASSGWVELSRGIYQAFPYSRLIDPSVDELRQIFRDQHAIALRYSTPLDLAAGKISYHIVCDRDKYSLRPLAKKARHDITNGLEYASYRPISMEQMACEGWELRYETLARQGRIKAETRGFWETLCLSAEKSAEFEAWGAIHDGKLVAALIACTENDTVNILYQQSLKKHLEFGVNNTLAYVFTQEVFKRPEVNCIFYGLHSLDAPPTVDRFKLRMGYSAKPVRQRVAFNPLIKPFVNKLSHGVLKGLQKVFSGSPAISKAEGMFHFYLDGERPLSEQDWPDILLEQKNSILDCSKEQY